MASKKSEEDEPSAAEELVAAKEIIKPNDTICETFNEQSSMPDTNSNVITKRQREHA